MAENLIFRPKPTVAWTELPDGAVLFAPDSEVYYSMNHVAAAIWELVANQALTLDGLCEQMQVRFPEADSAEIRNDIEELLRDLVTNGLMLEAEPSRVA